MAFDCGRVEDRRNDVSLESVLPLQPESIDVFRSRHFSVSKVVVLPGLNNLLEFLEAFLRDENVVSLKQIAQIESLRLFNLDILQVLCGQSKILVH